MWVLLGPVEPVDPPNAPSPIFVAVLAACREEVGKFPLKPGIQMGLVGATQPQGLQLLFSPTMTPSRWKLEGTTAAGGLDSDLLSWSSPLSPGR